MNLEKELSLDVFLISTFYGLLREELKEAGRAWGIHQFCGRGRIR